METISDSRAAHKASDFANGQVSNFLDSVEDLTKALKDIESPDIARVRAKVKVALVAAKRPNLRPHDLPKCFDVPFQRIGFRQVRLKMPSIVAPGGRTRPMMFTLPMEVRRFDGKPFTDLPERDAVTVDAQRRAETKVIRFVGLFAVEEAPQRAKHLGWIGVIHTHITSD